MSDPVLNCDSVSKSYTQGQQSIDVLNAIDLVVNAGERVSIVGVSGSGKSTLLNLLGGLDAPSNGRVEVCGKDLSMLSDNALSSLRNESLGFV